MKNILYISILCGVMFGINGCGKSVPSCSDSEVTELVAELSKDKILPYVIIKENGEKRVSYFDGASFLSLLSQNGLGNKLKNNATKKEQQLWDKISKAMEIAEKNLLKQIKITGIRTNHKDSVAKKVQCSAEIEHPDIRSYTIDYTAQYTEDNQVVVEIYE